MSAESDRAVRLGEITGVHGVRGWIRVHSYTEPRQNLLAYRSWVLAHGGRDRRVEVEEARESGQRLIAKLAGIDDRDGAAALIGASISVPRSALPPPAPGEYYWTDLEGLVVRNGSGDLLGRVDRLIATGANDVLVLEGPEERMIPFVQGSTVQRVDLDRGEIVVDWDTAFWE